MEWMRGVYQTAHSDTAARLGACRKGSFRASQRHAPRCVPGQDQVGDSLHFEDQAARPAVRAAGVPDAISWQHRVTTDGDALAEDIGAGLAIINDALLVLKSYMEAQGLEAAID